MRTDSSNPGNEPLGTFHGYEEVSVRNYWKSYEAYRIVPADDHYVTEHTSVAIEDTDKLLKLAMRVSGHSPSPGYH